MEAGPRRCRVDLCRSVALLRRRRDDRLFVTVLDERSGESFELAVRDGERPHDVFLHPYA
jgi:hypothetical protein